MTFVVTIENVRPPDRHDMVPWTDAILQESATSDGTFATIETFALSPVDSDPSAPAARNLTTSLGTAAGYWYRVYFEDGGGNESIPTEPIQNVVGIAYATVGELARVLKIRQPTDAEQAAMQRALDTAAGEINSEIDLADDADALSGWQIALVTQVNLERAQEHWESEQRKLGLIGLGSEVGPTRVSIDPWEWYAQKLAPLKDQWGMA
jgi:hypothetical protein